MSTITIQDLLKCASQTLTYDNDIPPSVPQYTITESELLCGERIVPEYPIPDLAFPSAVQMDTRLLTFETKDTTPLCLKPPTKESRKRYREEVAPVWTESNTLSPRTPRDNEEWLSWINWESME
jgi:hypothetical protein